MNINLELEEYIQATFGRVGFPVSPELREQLSSFTDQLNR